MNIPTSAEIGTGLESLARAVAPVLVAVYVAGLVTGTLARRLWRAYLRMRAAWCDWHDTTPIARPVSVAPVPQRKRRIKATVVKQPLTVEQLVAQHTQRELMALAGTRSKRSKRQLAEKILKMR